MRILIRVVVILLVVGIGAAIRGRSSHATTSAGGIPMVNASKDDPRLAAATAEAKRRWPEFTAAWKNKAGKTDFAVKHAFPVKTGGAEHMWVNITAIEGNQVKGTLDDQPLNDIGLKENDPVTLTPEEIEDWAFVENNHMVGGFSVPVLEAIEREQKNK